MTTGEDRVYNPATQEDEAMVVTGPYPCNCRICTPMYEEMYKKPSQDLAKLKRFGLFFSLQFLNYSLLCWNMRAVAFGWVGNVVCSDLLIAALSFTLIKKVAEAKDKTAMWGYIAGGAVGSAVSVLLTKYLWGS